MYDLRDQLRLRIALVRVGRREFSFGDFVLGSVDVEQGDEGPDAVEEEGDNAEINQEKYQDPSAHDWCGNGESRGKMGSQWGINVDRSMEVCGGN